MSKIPVSVCIIAKNEEKHIEECLKRIKYYGFEIVVTDTGSTDKTKEIALKYADKVLDFEWIGDFSAARIFCADNASNDFILSIDCDEYIEEIDTEYILAAMKQYPKIVGKIRLKNLAWNGNGEIAYNQEELVRFYNKKYYTFEYPIHEQICYMKKEKRDTQMDFFVIPGEIIHHGYAISPDEMKIKQKRNIDMLKMALIDSDMDKSYINFQIGQSMLVLANYEKAKEYFEESFKLMKKTNLLYSENLIDSLSNIYIYLEQPQKALLLYEDNKDRFVETAKFVYGYANVLLANEQYMRALLSYLKVTMMSDIDQLGEELLHCYERIIDLYEGMGDDKMADLFKNKLEKHKAERKRVVGKMLN